MQYLRDTVGLAALGWPLTLLVVIAIFFAISIAVAVQVSKRTKRKALWGWGIVLAAYLLVFWDHIPTILVHKYYCEKEAGFWVYKTLDQWKAENPGVMETLPAPSSTGSPTKYDRFDDGYGETFTYLLNERFNWIISQHDISGMLPIIRTEQQVKDIKGNEVLARYVDFATGNSVKRPIGPPGPLKFWKRSKHCIGGDHDQDELRDFRDQFYGTKK